MATDKDTIYIDIDDEITGIIDKLKGSEGKVVALVLPKRASVFQSIVNMKLLKRAADGAKKNVVLITSEAGLLPLAGSAGVHVAKTLSSKPEIPSAPSLAEEAEETVNESDVDDPIISPDQTVGELAGAAAVAPPVDNGVETIALDDEDIPPEDETKPAGPKSFKPPKTKKDKKLKIPDFNRFRLFLILGALLLIILIGVIVFATALNKATIDIKTDATNVSTNQNLTLSTSAETASPDGSSVPAKLEQQQKTYTQQVPTTGQKNNGNKASGNINMTATECAPNLGQPPDVPAGTGVSANGNTYITQQDTSFSPFGNGKGSCQNYQAAGTTPVIAQSAGASQNTPGGTSFTVAGRSDVNANGSATGGTDNIVQSVNQNDINSAKSKINTNDSSVKQALDSQLKGDGYYPIDATYSAGTPTTTSSANVGDVASTVTVTETVTYTMFGVHKSDLQSILDNNIKGQIDTSKQSILDDGLGSATYNINNLSSTGASLTMSAKAVIGPQLDTNAIKAAAAGQKAGAIQGQLNSNPDVTNVTVHFSPFWVSTAPKKTSRITINIAKPTTTKSSNGSSQ